MTTTPSSDHAPTSPIVRAALAGLAAGLGVSAMGLAGCGSPDAKKEGATSAAPTGAASATPAGAATVAQQHEKKADCCSGKNECKGKGGCKTASNECSGKNECKGKGGCSMRDCPK